MLVPAHDVLYLVRPEHHSMTVSRTWQPFHQLVHTIHSEDARQAWEVPARVLRYKHHGMYHTATLVLIFIRYRDITHDLKRGQLPCIASPE